MTFEVNVTLAEHSFPKCTISWEGTSTFLVWVSHFTWLDYANKDNRHPLNAYYVPSTPAVLCQLLSCILPTIL